jgi:putative ABC transport system substrate-binding protein
MGMIHLGVLRRRPTKRIALALAPLIGLPAVVAVQAPLKLPHAFLIYGPNLQEAYRRLALYIVRILHGARPENLPIEQPTVLELVISQKTAAAIDIALPPALLAQADGIIE